MTDRLIVLAGIGTLLLIGWLASTNRRNISLSIVGRSLLAQAAIGAFVLFLPLGQRLTGLLSSAVLTVIDTSEAGINMVFGGLASTELEFSFVVRVLPVIIFFSSLMSVLYYLGIMQLLVRVVGGALRRLVGVSQVEALNAAANVFVGLTEAPLAVRPFLSSLSAPQFFCVMVSGVASVAGSVLAAYSLMGVRMEYLLAASFMAAPGGLAMAKLLVPDEPRQTETGGATIEADAAEEPAEASGQRKDANVVLAAATGAADGLKLAINIAAMLIAFVSLVALFNLIVGQLTALVGWQGVTLESILGACFAPLMYLLGVPWSEAMLAGALFGEKLVLNEFVAFLHFAEVSATLSPRSEAIVSLSLCGFANISSIAVLLGGLGVLAPNQRPLIGRYGFHVVLAGSLSNLMSAGLVSLMLGG